MKKRLGTALIGAAILCTGAPAGVAVDWMYFDDGSGANDITNGGVRPPFVGTNVRGIAFYPHSVTGQETILVSALNDLDGFYVVRAENGTLLHAVDGISTEELSTFSVGTSEDGVIFLNDLSGTVHWCADDSPTPETGMLIASAELGPDPTQSRDMLVTGSVAEGTCRILYGVSIDGVLSLVALDVSGQIPNLTATVRDTVPLDQDGAPLFAAHAIAGDVHTVYVGSLVGDTRDVIVVEDGGDGMVPSPDDQYVPGDEELFLNQVAAQALLGGHHVVASDRFRLDPTFGNSGAWIELTVGVSGTEDNLIIASLGDGSAPNTEAVDAGVWDGDGNGHWDGGEVVLDTFLGGNLDARVRGGHLEIAVVAAQPGGYVGRLHVPIVPAEVRPPRIRPPAAALRLTQQQEFTANQPVRWSLHTLHGRPVTAEVFGTLTVSGPRSVVYQAPDRRPPANPLRLRGTSVFNPDLHGDAIVIVLRGRGHMHRRGDLDGDGAVNQTDVDIAGCLTLAPFALPAAIRTELDANGDGLLNAADVTTVVNESE